jgi:hypothetical protein
MVVVQIKLCTTVNTMMMAVQQRGYHNMKYNMQDSTKLQKENDWHKEIENLSAPLKRLFKDVSERERSAHGAWKKKALLPTTTIPYGTSQEEMMVVILGNLLMPEERKLIIAEQNPYIINHITSSQEEQVRRLPQLLQEDHHHCFS